MLGDHPVDIVLLATDLEAAKDFYANKVGLTILNGSPDSVTFKTGGGGNLVMTQSTWS